MPAAQAAPNTSAEETVRERIIATARSEFGAQGLKGASVRRIAAKAGITAAMINYYFRGKQGLYDEVVEEAVERLLEHLRVAFVAPSTEESLAVRLTGAYFDFLCTEQDLQRLLTREILARSETASSYTHRYMVPIAALLKNQIGEDEEVVQIAISVFGAVAAYFLYEPVLAELLGFDLLAPERLAARRRHLLAMVEQMSSQLDLT